MKHQGCIKHQALWLNGYVAICLCCYMVTIWLCGAMWTWSCIAMRLHGYRVMRLYRCAAKWPYGFMAKRADPLVMDAYCCPGPICLRRKRNAIGIWTCSGIWPSVTSKTKSVDQMGICDICCIFHLFCNGLLINGIAQLSHGIHLLSIAFLVFSTYRWNYSAN